MKFITFLIFYTILFIFIFNHYSSNHDNKWPISDHFDGKKFYNLDKEQKTFTDFIKWRWERNAEKWPNYVELEKYILPISKVKTDKIKITLIGHSTFLIQTSGLNIITDPVFSKHLGPYKLGPKRVTPAAIKFEDLPKIDIILISHNHYDHLDLPSVTKINNRDKPLILIPLGVKHNLNFSLRDCNYQEMDWWQEKEIDKKIKIDFVPAYHWSKRSIFDTNSTLWGGFVIKTPSGNIYFAGDTGFANGEIFKQMKNKYKNFKIALLPIGAYLPRWFMQPEHVSPDEAVTIAQILNPEITIPMHYNTFNLADDAYNQPIIDLHKAIKNPELFKVLKFGEPLEVQ